MWLEANLQGYTNTVPQSNAYNEEVPHRLARIIYTQNPLALLCFLILCFRLPIKHNLRRLREVLWR
jgi:hypothetical protein